MAERRSPHAEQLYAHAYAQYEAGNAEKAVEGFQALCLQNPLEARFWFGLGASLQESHSYEHALQSWAMAALLDPANPYPHFYAAECSVSLNLLDDASLALDLAMQRIQSEETHPLKEPILVLKEAWSLCQTRT